MKRRVTVWSNPNDAEGFRFLCEPPVIQCSVNERAADDSPGGGSITIPADYEHLDLILSHDPDSVGDNYSSLIVVEQDDGDGWRPVYEFYAEDTDEQLTDGGQVTIVGPHIKAGADDGVVGPLNSANPHWEWGAPTLTRNADLSESSTTSEEIALWVSDGASGSFTVDVESSGSPATIDVGDSASDVKTAFEGLSTVDDVRVSGSGTVADPWHVIFNDPDHVNLFIQTNSGGLTGTLSLDVLVEGGQAFPTFWVKSQNVEGVVFGDHTGSSLRVVEDPLDANEVCVEINGTLPFTGAMQILDVNPGQHYATCEVLPANGTEEYRLVVRTPDEGFVASSGGTGGYEGVTLTADTWNDVTTGQFEIDPLDGGRIFFRIAVVSEGDPGTFYVRNLKLHPGFPGTTAGDIVQTLKDGAEDRGALDWLANDFNETVDSNGDPWDTDELAFQADAGEKLATHVLGDLAASTGVNKTSVGGGYEWTIIRIPDDESSSFDGATHLLQLFNPGQMGSTSSQAVVVGTTTGGRVAKRRVPFTHLLVRTYDDEYVWVTDARLAGIPRREEFYDAEQARDIATAQKIGGQVFDAMIENLFATEVQLGGPGVRAYRDFGIGWTVPYVLGSKRAGKHNRRIHSITLGFDGKKWTDTIHASRMYAPGGKDSPLVLEGLAKIYRLFNRRRRPERKGAIILPTPVDASFYTDSGQATVVDSITSYEAGNPTSHSIQLTSAQGSGDLLLMLLNAAGGTWTHPAGWTVLVDNALWGNSSGRFSVLYKVSDGTETGTVTGTTSLGTRSVHSVWCVRANGIDFTTFPPEVGATHKVADTNTIDLPSVTPSHGAADYLIFPLIARNGGHLEPIQTLPSGYTTLEVAGPSGSATDPGIWVGQQLVAVTTAEDPGSLTYQNLWTATRLGSVTVAVFAEAEAEVAAGVHTHTEDEVSDIDTLSQKATPVNADRVKIYDSEDSDTFKYAELGDLPGGGGASSLDDLDDVTITGTPADNEVLAYDTGTSEFINQTAAEAGLATSGHVHAIDDLSDVDTTTDAPTNGQVLKWDGSNWVPDDDDTGSGLPTGTTKGDLAVYDGSDWVRIGAGANDTVLTADSAQTEGIKWAAAGGGGGGGKSYITEPGAYPPDSAHADDDEFDQSNGSDPTSNGWSWGNQASVTAEIRGGRLRVDAASSSSRAMHGLFKAVPGSGDVSIATRTVSTAKANNHSSGIALLWGTLATPTDIEYLRFGQIASVIDNLFWTQNSAYATGVANRGNIALGVEYMYLRFLYNATAGNVQGFWSHSPLGASDWVQVGAAQSKGSRPDFMGVFVYDESTVPSATNPLVAQFDFFRVNWTPDFDASTDV